MTRKSNFQSVKAPNIRLSGPLGGGPVGDVGIYCINAARYTIGEEPIDVMAIQAQPKSDPRFTEVPETSASFCVTLRALSPRASAPSARRRSSYEVVCEKGVIMMDPAYTYQGLRLSTESEVDGIPTKTALQIPMVDQFAAEMDAFSNAVMSGKPVRTPGEMGLRDIRIILAVMESALRDGAPVRVG